MNVYGFLSLLFRLLHFIDDRDAGIVLATYFGYVVSTPESMLSISKIMKPNTLERPRILELGSGCGIVGLEAAHLCSGSKVSLTDLPEAMGILGQNVSKTSSSTRSRVSTAILDWDNPLPYAIARSRFDLLIVSDCTYNPDSGPALVNTLVAIITGSPAALIIVSMKRRHDSEAAFFDLMAGAGFVEVESKTVRLPDKTRQVTEQPLEVVEIYVYRKGRPNHHM